VTRFDIRETRILPIYKRIRLVSWVLWGFIGVAAVVGGYDLFHLAGSGWTPLESAYLAGLSIVLILIGWIALILGPGAEYLEVDDDGVRLEYHAGRTVSWKWAQPRFNLRMDQLTNGPDTSPARPTIQFAYGSRPVQNFLTQEAFDETIRRARDLGLQVEIGPSPRRGWTRYAIHR
jgi:hypothetical protein